MHILQYPPYNKLMYNRKTKAKSCSRRPKPSLTPIQNLNFYYTPKKEDTSLINSLDQIEKQVLGVITEVDDKISYLQSHPKKYYTPEPYSSKKVTLEPISLQKSKFHINALHLSPSPLGNPSKKYLSRKTSIVKLMQSTNSFNLPKLYRESLMHKLTKQINRSKKPCIQGIFSEILSKEGIFDAYKQRASETPSPCPYLNYSKTCEAEKSPPVPVLTHAQDTSLVLNRYNLGKGISTALSKAISLMPHLRAVHLDENGLSDAAGAEILKGLACHGTISSFYYTHNEIGPRFFSEFSHLSTTPLIELNFKGCKISRQIIVEFMWEIRLFRSLKKLCLAETGLSVLAVEKLARVLAHSRLVYLDLSWNQIPHEASSVFFSKLGKNSSLKFLDYSWNPLTDHAQTKILCSLIANHPTLMHLNLSHTQIPCISPYNCALRSSKHMIGLHLTGNNIEKSGLPPLVLPKLYPNSANFLCFSTKPNHTSYNLKHRDNNGRLLITHNDSVVNIDSPKKSIDKHMIVESKEVILSRVLGQSDIKSSENWGVSEHCWVCERWGVYHLKVTLDSLQVVATPDIFHSRTIRGCKLVLKPSFNNWKDVEFEALDEGKGEYEVSVLIPPGKHRFWIICDDKSVCVTRKISTERWNDLMVNQFIMPLRELEISLSGEMQYLVVPVFDKNKSVFRYFLEDTEAILKASFDSDLKYVRLNRIVRDYVEMDQTIIVLNQNYAQIVAVFKELILGPCYPCIDKAGVTNFVYTCGLIDQVLTVEKLNNVFQMVSAEFIEAHPMGSEFKLRRFDFIDIIVRLSLAKFNNHDTPPCVKLQQLLDEYIYKVPSPPKSSRFRKEKMYNLEVNEILERNLSGMQNLLNRHKEEAGRWISLAKAQGLLLSVKWELSAEVVLRLFGASKMSVIDEMNPETYYDKLQFVEMLEFICRVIDSLVTEEITLDQKLIIKLPLLLEANKIKFIQKSLVPESRDNQ